LNSILMHDSCNPKSNLINHSLMFPSTFGGAPPFLQGDAPQLQVVPPSDVCWFMNHSKYRYIYICHKHP
jgi:hypothetical protein